MSSPLDQICYASLPPPALAVLADLRCATGVRIALVGGRAWVRWPPGDEAVLRRLFPVAGVELYAYREGLWYRLGRHLPSFDLPTEAETQPLDQVVVPAPVQPVAAATPAIEPLLVRLVRDDRSRQAIGLACRLADLARWADGATTAHLASLQAARSTDQVLVLGRRLPPLPGGERFWGKQVLTPLGFRPEPALLEPELRQALGAAEEELVVLRSDAAEVVPLDVFQPLNRAGLRLALRERP